MVGSHQYQVTGIDLSGTQYTVEEVGQDYRSRYEVIDATGDTIFRGHEEMDEFPFVDADGNEVCTVKGPDNVHVAGDYVLRDSHTEEDLVILDNDLSFLQDTWRIRDADDRTLIAEINSRGALFTVARKVLPLGQFIAHEFEISDAEGDPVGSIEGEHAIYNQYEITITEPGSVPMDPIVVATIVIDEIQAN